MINKKRVQELEKRSKRKVSDVLAVWYEDEPMLQVCGSDEMLTPVEFGAKYPDGTIIHVVYQAAPVSLSFA